MSQRDRLIKAAVGFGCQVGLARLFVRNRLSDARGTHGPDLIENELPKLLGVPRVDVAISIGRGLRPNVKPVLQIMAPDGRVLAFAKLAWNVVTAELLENEARTLEVLERQTIRSFRVPRVIHHGEWNGHQLLVLSPLLHDWRRRWPIDELPSLRVVREVAELSDGEAGPLGGTAYWQELSRRAVEAARHQFEDERLQDALAALSNRVSAVEVVPSMSHGDFAPWNMLHTRESLNIWDWERASDSRPLGLDVLHFCFEVAYHRHGLDPVAAIGTAVERAQPALAQLGLPSTVAGSIQDVYVLDRLTRLLDGRRAAVPVDARLLDGLAGFLIDRYGGFAAAGGVPDAS